MILDPSERDGRSERFHVRFRGFDRREVVAALAKFASENQEARREVDRLGAELERLRALMIDLRDHERHAQRALVSAHKAADEIRERAEQEARQIAAAAEEIRARAKQEAGRALREAEASGELLLHQAREQARQMEGQIDGLVARRQKAETNLESFVNLLADALAEARREHRGQSEKSIEGDFGDALAPTG